MFFEVELDFVDSVSIESMREFVSSLTRAEARFLAIGLYVSLCEMEEVEEDSFFALEAQFAVHTLDMSTIELRGLCFDLWQQIIVSDALFELEEEEDDDE